MLIQEMRKHFPARMPEWINAGIMATWGAFAVLHPELFDGLVFWWTWTPIGEPTAFWGLVIFAVGMIRAAALFVNGAYSRTPLIRLGASAISAFVWTQVFVGMWDANSRTIIILPWLLVMDLISGYRAGMDVALAEARRRQVNEGGNVSPICRSSQGRSRV